MWIAPYGCVQLGYELSALDSPQSGLDAGLVPTASGSAGAAGSAGQAGATASSAGSAGAAGSTAGGAGGAAGSAGAAGSTAGSAGSAGAGSADSGLPPLTSSYSLAFDGTNDYVSFGELTLPSGTISLWLKATTAANAYLVSRVQAGGSVEGELRLMLDAGRVILRIEDPAVREISSDGLVNDGLWHHVVATFNPGMQLFVDGQAQAQTDTLAVRGMQVAGVATELGRNNALLDSRYSGQLDELVLFEQRWTAPEVLELWNEGSPADPRTLSTAAAVVHWWSLGDGDVAPDLGDGVGSVTGQMVNMSAASIVADAP